MSSPYTSYAAVGTVTITSEWKTYTVSFTPNTTDPNTRITFFLGDKMPNGSKLYLDSLSFTEATPEVSTEFTYDDLGRLVYQSEANGMTKSFAYDAADNRKSFVLKQNNVTKLNNTYQYDNLNRLYKVFDNGSLVVTYLYDSNGNRQTLTYPNGITTSYNYNLQNKVTKLTNKKGTTVLTDYDYTYYADGSQESYKDLVTGKSSKYEYDDLRRLTQETELKDTTTASTTVYTYDDANNRDSMTTTRGNVISSTSYQYVGNRLDTETRTVGNKSLVTSYGYDDNGNLLTKSLNSVVAATSTYDALNQLQTYTEGNVVSSYTYNDSGLRISKDVGGIITNFVLDGQDVVMETDTAGAVKSKFIRGINLIAFVDSIGTKKYYLFNAHGDVVQLTDVSGNVVTDYSYDGFGNRELLLGDLNNDDIINMDDYLIIRDYMIGVFTVFPTLDGNIKADVDGDGNIDSDDLSYIAMYNLGMIKVFPGDKNLNGYADENEININYVDVNPFRYCGEYFDKETGSIYLRARYYNPGIGRFITEDSYRGKDNDPLSLNLYTYCENDPVNYFDYNGHWKKEIHYDKTLSWAENAGFSSAYAKIIAEADNNVDSDPKTQPLSISNSNLSWHFNRNSKGKEDSRQEHFEQNYKRAVETWNNAIVTGMNKAMKINSATGNKMSFVEISKLAQKLIQSERTDALKVFGQGLHALQDIYAHKEWAVGSPIVLPHMVNGNILDFKDRIDKFDDPNYDLYRFIDGGYIAVKGTTRITTTQNITEYWLSQFLVDTKQK